MSDEPRVVAGRYRLVTMINWGGMGVVWRAEDLLIDREVAVKELRAPVGTSEPEWREFTERALREARSTGRIRHPGVAAIHDVVLAENAIYLVMELLDGEDLLQVIDQTGKLDETRVLNIARQLLDALAAAHAENVVHRDVKPGNIMVLPDDTVKLVDFGIAHALGETRMTYNAVIGTRAFMAPELFGRGEITAAVDMWSLGATLYAAVDGESPFVRDSEAATLSALLFDPIPTPKCGSPLKDVIAALLTRDPDERAGIDDVRALLAGRQPDKTLKTTAKIEQQEPPKNQPPKNQPPKGKPPANRSGLAWGAAALVVLVLLGVPELRKGVVDFFSGKPSSSTATSTPTTTRTTDSYVPFSPTSRTTTSTSSEETTSSTRTTTTTSDTGSPDAASTDKTPFTAAALMPDSFTDDKGVLYKYQAGGVHDCVQQEMSQSVKDILNRAGCARMVTGDFVSHDDHILVSVQVYAFEDTDAADAVYKKLDAAQNVYFGIWCPNSGTGSSACKGDRSKATRSTYIGQHRRYVVSAFALYINLTNDRSVKPWLDSAASEAVTAVGPQNYS